MYGWNKSRHELNIEKNLKAKNYEPEHRSKNFEPLPYTSRPTFGSEEYWELRNTLKCSESVLKENKNKHLKFKQTHLKMRALQESTEVHKELLDRYECAQYAYDEYCKDMKRARD